MENEDFEALMEKFKPNLDFGLKIKRIQHYQFVFKTLPNLVFEQKEQLLKKWIIKEDADKFLKQTWEETGKELPDQLSPEGISLSITNRNGWSIYIINLPKPEIQPEAYYCLILFNPSSQSLKYYTVEKGLGRNILGEVTKNGSHGNHGGIENLNLDKIIDEILSKNQ